MSRRDTIYLIIMTVVSIATVLTLYVHVNQPPGIVVKKYFYPAHVKTWGQPEDGEGKTEFTPGPNVYLIRPVSKNIPDQYILQISTGKEEGMALVSQETWIRNTPGKPFVGTTYQLVPIW